MDILTGAWLDKRNAEKILVVNLHSKNHSPRASMPCNTDPPTVPNNADLMGHLTPMLGLYHYVVDLANSFLSIGITTNRINLPSSRRAGSK